MCHDVKYNHNQLGLCQYTYIMHFMGGQSTSKFVYFLDSTGKLLILQNLFITFNKNKHRDFSVNLCNFFDLYILIFSMIHIFPFFQ